MQEVSPIDQLEATIRDIERTVRNFSISGPGVSGHIRSGYVVNARPGASQAGEGAGGGGPTDKCIHTGDTTIVFDSISLCSGCIDLTSVGAGVKSVDGLVYPELNGTFAGIRFMTGPPIDVWLRQGIGDHLNYNQYTSDGACSGSSIPSGDSGQNIWVMCEARGIKILAQFDHLAFFYTDWITGTPTSIANLATCGGAINDADWGAILGSPLYVGVTSGGTATLTFP